MADDDVPPLVGVLPIPKPDPPAKKQAPLANFERERFAFSDF